MMVKSRGRFVQQQKSVIRVKNNPAGVILYNKKHIGTLLPMKPFGCLMYGLALKDRYSQSHPSARDPLSRIN